MRLVWTLILVAGVGAGVEIGPVQLAADQEAAAWQVWDSPVGNRPNVSGPIFYVRRTASGPDTALLRFGAMGTEGRFSDGLPANLVLRVFGPDDRCLAARAIGQLDKQVYEVAVDLAGAPAGRYRLALVGHFREAAVTTAPATEVGVCGGGTLGLFAPGTWYVNVPPDVAAWTLRATGIRVDQTAAVTPPGGESVTAALSRSKHPAATSYTDIPLTNPGGADRVWRLDLAGEGRTAVDVVGVPAVFWPSAAAAAVPDYAYVGKRRIDHEWQRPFAEWLAARTAADFALPELPLPQPDFAAMPAEELFKLVHYQPWHNGLVTAISLVRDNQIVDPANPGVGLFADDPATADLALNPDGDNVSKDMIFYLRGITGLYVGDMGGLNPYAGNPALRNRVYAALCQQLLFTPEDQHVTMSFVEDKWFGLLMSLLVPNLPPELQEPARAAIIERGGRDFYFDGYQSNQGLNVLLGLHDALKIVDDPVLAAFHARILNAYFNNLYRYNNHGQQPAGYYQESGGFDGAYNTYSLQLMIELWRDTGEERFRQSIEKAYELLRHLAVTLPDGTLTSARQWNTRTDSNAFRWHDHAGGGDIPRVATFLRRYRDHHVYTMDTKRIAEGLARVWNHKYPARLDGRKFWSGGGLDYGRRVPYAENPPPLACEETDPFMRAFGNNFCAWRDGPWYAVLYGGDTWCVGDSGSGLATLWHQDFGPLLCGDTRIDREDKPEVPLAFADTWTAGDTPFSDAKWQGVITPGEASVEIALGPRAKPPLIHRRYQLRDGVFASTARPADGTWTDHAVIFPLVSGPAVELTALDADGKPLDEIPDNAVLSGWRWTCGNQRAELRYELPVPTTVLDAADKAGAITLTVVRADFGALPGAWTLQVN